MNPGKVIRRFFIPQFIVSIIYLIKSKCFISFKSEVEFNPSRLKIGAKTNISSFCKIKAVSGPLTIGANGSIGAGCFISSNEGGIEIGDYCLISPNVSIIGSNYIYDQIDVPFCEQGHTSKGIKIGRNVWIGSNSSILDGAELGDNVIVTPNTVVSQKVAPNTIVQGNPAKVIFTRR